MAIFFASDLEGFVDRTLTRHGLSGTFEQCNQTEQSVPDSSAAPVSVTAKAPTATPDQLKTN